MKLSAIVALLFFSLSLPEMAPAAQPREVTLPAASPRQDFIDAEGWFLKGLAANQGGRYQEAVEAFGRVIAINPGDPQAHFNLGTALTLLGRYKEAVASLEESVRLDPDFPQAYANLAAVASELKDWKLAVDAYRQLTRLQPGNASAGYGLGHALLELGEHDAARAEAETLKLLDPALAEKLLEEINSHTRKPN